MWNYSSGFLGVRMWLSWDTQAWLNSFHINRPFTQIIWGWWLSLKTELFFFKERLLENNIVSQAIDDDSHLIPSDFELYFRGDS